MSKYVCKQCGADNFAAVETTPRLRAISVETANGSPVEGYRDGYDELFYEDSSTTGYQCLDCEAAADDLADLVRKVR